MAVLDDGLAINDCRLAAEVGGGTDDGRIAVAPIVPIAGEDTGFSSLNQHSIAIVFDFVNPVLALWWLLNQGGKLWLDKPEPCRKHYFCTCLDRLQKKPRTVSARASSALKEVRHDNGWRPSPPPKTTTRCGLINPT